MKSLLFILAILFSSSSFGELLYAHNGAPASGVAASGYIFGSGAAAGGALCAGISAYTRIPTGLAYITGTTSGSIYCTSTDSRYTPPIVNTFYAGGFGSLLVADCVLPAVRQADGTCAVPPRDCDSIKNTSYAGYIPGTANPASVCQDGCSASVVSASNQASVDGQQVIAGTFSYTGGTCTGNDITGGTPPVCPSGQCVGQINGANACFTCADVAKTATEYIQTSDSTIKTTTYNSDGSTTTTITDTGTGTTSSPTVVQKTEQQTYCEQNPTAITCLDTQDDPVTPVEPSLENAPSGASIFSAIKDFVQIQPSNFSHTSQCPTSSFDWNGHSFVINQHCALVSDHWAILSTAMLTAWTVLSLFVVLKA